MKLDKMKIVFTHECCFFDGNTLHQNVVSKFMLTLCYPSPTGKSEGPLGIPVSGHPPCEFASVSDFQGIADMKDRRPK